MKKIQIIGQVGKNIETIDEGAKTRFSVRVERQIAKKDGTSDQIVTMAKVTVATAKVQNIKAGDGIFLRGEFSVKHVQEEGKSYGIFEVLPSFVQLGSNQAGLHNLFVEVIGYIGGENRVAVIGEQSCCNFSVATNDRVYVDGAHQEVTTWVASTLWRPRLGAKVFDYLTKGMRVYIAGLPILRVWGDNKDRLSLDLTVSELELLGQSGAKEDREVPDEEKSDDGLPF